MKAEAVWDSFKKLMPEESTRAIKYKRAGLNSIELSMKDGTKATFSLGRNTFSYIKTIH